MLEFLQGVMIGFGFVSIPVWIYAIATVLDRKVEDWGRKADYTYEEFGDTDGPQ